jgi:hypothetical protein
MGIRPNGREGRMGKDLPPGVPPPTLEARIGLLASVYDMSAGKWAM